MLCALQKKILNRPNLPAIETYALQETDYSFQVVTSILNIRELWDSLAPAHNLLLQSAFLGAIETYPPEKMSFRYLVFYKDAQPIGIAYTQIFFIQPAKSIQKKSKAEETQSKACFLTALKEKFQGWLLRRSEFYLLICGNLLLTGEYGFHFVENISTEQSLQLLEQALDALPALVQEQTQEKISISFFKDYYLDTRPEIKQKLEKSGYHTFQMQPCMRLDLLPEWKTFDNYLDAMHSKYRVRARRAVKKGLEIQKKEFSLEEIEANLPALHELYKKVADNAGFNAFVLHPRYFYGLKEFLGDNYKLVAYFIGDELVAFYTGILNGNDLDAHFLGVNDKYNPTHQVYLNILYDLVRMGLYHEKGHIDFARTALEIKSSIGAVPQSMNCFIRHRNSFSSTIIKYLIDYFNTQEVWTQRHPFKHSPEEPEGGE